MSFHPHTEIPFHSGDGCQNAEGMESEPRAADLLALSAHRATLRVPGARPRFGVDADGNPIEPPLGGIPFDSETGTLMTPDRWAAATAPPAPPPTTTSSKTSSSTSSSSTA